MAIYQPRDGALLSYEHERKVGAPHGTPTLLFVHGWIANGSVWGPLREYLPQYSSIVVDLRGMGASREAPGPYRIERFANDLSDLLRTLAPEPPLVVVGHSCGGTVALRLALDTPELLDALVLIAPVPASGWRLSPRGDAFMRAVPYDAEKRRSWLASMTSIAPLPELLAEAAATVAPAAALECYESWTGANFAEETTRIGVPTLAIAPSEDRPITVEVIREEVIARIPSGKMEQLDRAAHYAQLDRPQAVAQCIASFLNDTFLHERESGRGKPSTRRT